MGKKKNNVLVISIAMIVLLAIFYFSASAIFKFGLFSQEGFTAGFTVNSISPNIQFFNGKPTPDSRFLVTLTLDGTAQKIVGEISPSKFQEQTNYLTNAPLQIEVDSIDEILDYKIENNKVPIFNYQIQFQDSGFLSSAPPCPSNTFKEYHYGIPTKRVCVLKNQVGIKGSLTNPTVKNQATFSLTVNGEKITKTVSNSDTFVSFVESSGKERANARFTGSLITGDPVPNGNNRVPVYSLARSEWNLALPTDFTTYDSSRISSEQAINNHINQNFATFCKTFETGKDCAIRILNNDIATANSYANNLLNARYSLEGVSVSQPINKNSQDNSIIRINSDRKIGNAQVVLQVDATWLGVVQMQGKPNIQSLSCPSFNSGDKGSIEVTVKNDADSKATFYYTVTNCDPFQASFSSFTNSQNFNAQETKTIKIDLNPSVAVNTEKTCTITVKDSVSNNQDSDTVSCKVKVPLLCNPNSQLLNGNCVIQCKSDGTGYDVNNPILCCEKDIIPSAIQGSIPTKYQCPDSKSCTNGAVNPPSCNQCSGNLTFDSSKNLCIEKGQYCQNEVKFLGISILPDFEGVKPAEGLTSLIKDAVPCVSTLDTIKWVVAVIIFLASLFIIYLLMYKIFSNLDKKFRKREGIYITISIIFSIMLSTLLYILFYKIFYLALIIFAVSLIASASLKKVGVRR